jgi:hypothetical protein
LNKKLLDLLDSNYEKQIKIGLNFIIINGQRWDSIDDCLKLSTLLWVSLKKKNFAMTIESISPSCASIEIFYFL